MASRRGVGSIRKLPSGKYQVRFTDPFGIRRTARTTFQTKSLAEFELTRIRGAIENGTWHIDETPQAGDLDPRTIKLKELAAHWRAQQVSSKGFPLSPNTLSEYQRLIERVLIDFADKPIRSITRQQIEKWRAPELKRAPNQTVKAYKHLKTLMTWAHKRNWISFNPCDIERGSAYTPSEPPAPTKDQVRIMVEGTEGAFQAILALAAFGGLRKGEILELRRKDLDIIQEQGERWVRVSVGRGVIWNNGIPIVRKPKTDAGIRSLLLPLGASELLIKYLTQVPIDPEALLFARSSGPNEHYGEWDINPKWRKAKALSGYKGRFHSLRTYAATEFAKANPTSRELMDRFGHRDIKTAMRYQRVTGRESELLRKLAG
jgi:integrase